ncbi:MAG: TolC family protein [Parachlamydiaceae bacterium]
MSYTKRGSKIEISTALNLRSCDRKKLCVSLNSMLQSLSVYTIFSAFLLSLLVGCNEFTYDPSFSGDAPSSPGSEWKGKSITYPKQTVVRPFTAEDLSSTISVAKLLDIALFNNPSTRSSWYAARASAYAYRTSLSEYYPAIAFTSTLTAESDTIGASSGSTVTSATQATALSNTGTTARGPTTAAISGNSQIDTNFNEVTASWLMFDFGGRDAQATLALETLYQANWQHNFTLQQVMMNVLDYYTSYNGNKALVAADEQNLKDAEMSLKAALTMRNAGLATMTDVLQAQAAVEQARTTLIYAQGEEKTSLGELVIAVGLAPETKLSVESLPDQLPVIEISGDLDHLLEVAKHKRPDIGAAIAVVKQQEAMRDISFSAGMPTVSTNAQWSRLHFIHNPIADGHNNNISINLNVPIFQGFYYKNQLKQMRNQVQEALANLDVQLSTVASEVVTNYYAFTSAVAALPSSIANLEFSERAFRGYLSQYKVGTASILDVLNALTTLSNARAQLIVTRTQWAASLANLAFSVGVLDETKGHWRETPPKELFNIPFKDKAES